MQFVVYIYTYRCRYIHIHTFVILKDRSNQLLCCVIHNYPFIVCLIIGGGVDYSFVQQTPRIPANSKGVVLSISIKDDDLFEANEMFNLAINHSSLPSGVVAGRMSPVTVIIIDNECE